MIFSMSRARTTLLLTTSRPVRIIIRSPEAMWLGLDQENFQAQQKEESVWEELTEYLKGRKLPTKCLPKTTLD